MAVFSKIVVVFSVFAALTAARPLAIRDMTSFVTETAYTTVEDIVTLWVDENGKPLSTVTSGGNFAASATPVASSATTTATASPSPVAESSKIEMSASPSTPQVAPVVPTTTAAPQVQAYTPAPTPTPSPISSTTTPAAVAVATNNAQSGQTSGECQGSGNVCTGDITHWDGGLGACGWNVDTNSDYQIALPVGLMGSLSNSNPYCGKSLTIKNPNTGATVQATVGDKCMGCTGDSIDLTNALFNSIGGGCDGRCSGFQWWFN